MGTSSGIALKSGDTYQTIYCHWDGHPKTMFPILHNHYNSLKLAAKLISYGNASSIDAKLEPTEGVVHTFDNPEDGVCVFYHRDRGEDWIECSPSCYTRSELFSQPGFEFIYIFEDGQWNAYNTNGRKLNCGGLYER